MGHILTQKFYFFTLTHVLFQSYPTSEEVMQIYDKMARDIEQHLQHVIGVPGTNPLYAQMTNLLETVIHARNSRDVQSSMALLQKVVLVQLYGLFLQKYT